ncbi:bifunctional phosphoribosylaminoimidazolecarboxamide formyltransferase/IMP cyclohydrolase [Virgibacillus soli]|uniref:bifunctional phosphoribosylaminoimidazolecarboxamide formyltransferase/IMP cyclohydrolase n=1 Tax=Paracerasibacillus soli TaxID=480284 RepID=UPI0035E90867
MKKRALLSVSDKTGIVDFAKSLIQLNYEIISTGGTLRALEEAGIPVIAVDEITSFPEILNGRVKTLHPHVHGGILAKRHQPTHHNELQQHGITYIDLVAVNLYPFKQTLEQINATHDEIMEQIDIGGPTMLRAAAKNYVDVAVVVDPEDYSMVVQTLEKNELNAETRLHLAAKVFRHTAHYDALIAQYFSEITNNPFPETYTVTYEKAQTLRYGENPHQQAALYREPIITSKGLASATQLHGKEMSYNNIQDANACLEILQTYEEPAAVAVKHMNPCGIGIADTIETAFARAYEGDTTSIFGGIVAVNREVSEALAKKLQSIFLEIIIAPSFSTEALEILQKKRNLRLLALRDKHQSVLQIQSQFNLNSTNGLLLVQQKDQFPLNREEWTYPTERKPTEEEWSDLRFAWKAVKYVKSNAIVLAKDGQTIGIGAGQMNRVGAAKIAINQAGDKAEGAVMASDAFFPMPDTVEAAAKAGIKAIIQPGGSKRDQDSIDLCNLHGIAMVFTNRRHFRH